jgi:hypothetical protein
MGEPRCATIASQTAAASAGKIIIFLADDNVPVLESKQQLGLEDHDDIDDAMKTMRSIYEGSPMDNFLRYPNFMLAFTFRKRSGKEA